MCYLDHSQLWEILSKICFIKREHIHHNSPCCGCFSCFRLYSFLSYQRFWGYISSSWADRFFCFRASLKNKEMKHLLLVLWEAGKHQQSPGNSCRCTSHSSSAKGAVSLGINYLAINPTHWIRLLGERSLCVCVSVWLCMWVYHKAEVWPLQELPIMLTFDTGWRRRLAQIQRYRNLAITAVCWLWLGLPRESTSKGQICAQFSKAGLFLFICKPRGNTDTGLLAFLFCFYFVSELQPQWSWHQNLFG